MTSSRLLTASALAADELDLTATPSRTEDAATEIYDSTSDVWGGVREAFALIRERMRNGGQGWSPR
jgi:hypothetical protein